MGYIPGIGYYSSPQDLLQNEWVIFAGIFLLVFAIVFYSIRNFLGKKGERFFDFTSGKYKTGNNEYLIPAVVSGVIAFFTAAAVSQDYLIYQMFGNVLGGWVLIFVLIVLIILTLPFFKALKHAFGSNAIAGVISGGLLGVGYWYLLGYINYSNIISNMPYQAQSILNFFTSAGGLVLLIIIGIFIGIIIPARRS